MVDVRKHVQERRAKVSAKAEAEKRAAELRQTAEAQALRDGIAFLQQSVEPRLNEVVQQLHAENIRAGFTTEYSRRARLHFMFQPPSGSYKKSWVLRIESDGQIVRTALIDGDDPNRVWQDFSASHANTYDGVLERAIEYALNNYLYTFEGDLGP